MSLSLLFSTNQLCFSVMYALCLLDRKLMPEILANHLFSYLSKTILQLFDIQII